MSRHCSVTLDDGVVLMHWRSVLDRPVDVGVIDDSGFVHFSHVLHGGGTAQLGEHFVPRQRTEVKPIQAATGNIAFGLGSGGAFSGRMNPRAWASW